MGGHQQRGQRSRVYEAGGAGGHFAAPAGIRSVPPLVDPLTIPIKVSCPVACSLLKLFAGPAPSVPPAPPATPVTQAPALPTVVAAAVAPPVAAAAPPAAGPSHSKYMCPLCRANTSGYFVKVCKHPGPCRECMPQIGQWSTVYPACLHLTPAGTTCGTAIDDGNIMIFPPHASVKFRWENGCLVCYLTLPYCILRGFSDLLLRALDL